MVPKLLSVFLGVWGLVEGVTGLCGALVVLGLCGMFDPCWLRHRIARLLEARAVPEISHSHCHSPG